MPRQMENLHPVHRSPSSYFTPLDKPILKAAQRHHNLGPESRTQEVSQSQVHMLTKRSHTQGLKGQKAPKMHSPEYRYTHPRGFVVWLTKSTQIKYPITHDSAQRLKEIKCSQTAPVLSHAAIHKPTLPDTG
ncbi:unnamed protein product [Rangifer tarandus platyrhynchus]|uniref:Uncharacterized protein n=1 Tax=Rangifer tarandus platyrhynchus TaxID=3082113 RepID=A0ABN9A3F7_RANTA|nr:unnamed protein product [Rangifer tarandus platyrhynchus]